MNYCDNCTKHSYNELGEEQIGKLFLLRKRFTTAKGAKIAKFRKGVSLALLCDSFALLATLAVEAS